MNQALSNAHRRLLARIEADASRAQSAIADDAVALSRRLVHVKTGALRDSLGQTTAGLRTVFFAGTGHAVANEFGDAHLAPRPFMMPAVQSLRARFAGAVAGKLK